MKLNQLTAVPLVDNYSILEFFFLAGLGTCGELFFQKRDISIFLNTFVQIVIELCVAGVISQTAVGLVELRKIQKWMDNQ